MGKSVSSCTGRGTNRISHGKEAKTVATEGIVDAKDSNELIKAQFLYLGSGSSKISIKL